MKLFLRRLIELFFITALLFGVIAIAKPYFFSKISSYSQLGFNTVIIEDRDSERNDNAQIFKGEVIQESLTAQENNLGMVLIKFDTFGKINDDTIQFRIREKSSRNWYYQEDYLVDQFQNNTYFTFGFPNINESKGKSYIIEIESLRGNKGDAVAISSDVPQFASAYNVSPELGKGSLNFLIKFFIYKFSYAITNIPLQDYLYLSSIIALFITFHFSRLISSLMQRLLSPLCSKILSVIPKFFKFFRRHTLSVISIIQKVSLEKKFENRISRKKILVIFSVLILLFFASLFFNYSEYLDFSDKAGREGLFTSTLGASSDAQAEIMCAAEIVRNGEYNCFRAPNLANYFFITPYMGLIMDNFGFIRGLEFIAYTTIIVGGLITITPFLLLSYLRKGFSIGGFFASLAILVNSLLIINASGRVVKYSSSLLFFTIFFIIYYFAVKKRTIWWMVLLGIWAFLDSLNKPFHLFNNFPLLLIFPFIVNIDLFKILKKFPFISIKNAKLFWKSFLPIGVFTLSIVIYHFIYYQLFHVKWYIWSAYVNNNLAGTGNFLSRSIVTEGSFFLKIINSALSIFYGTHTAINFSEIPFYIFITLITILILKRYSLRVLIFSGLGLLLISLITSLFIQSSLVNKNIFSIVTTFGVFDFIKIYTFFSFLFLLALQSRILLAVVAVQFFYLIELSLAIGSTQQSHLFVTLIFWIILCVGMAIDYLFKQKISFLSSSKAYLRMSTFILIVFIFFLPGVINLVNQSMINIRIAREEKKYLIWVGEVLPKDAIILGGKEDNLLWMSPLTKKTVLYSALWNPYTVTPDMEIKDLRSLDYKFVDVLQNNTDSEIKQTKIFFLDNGVDFWLNGSWIWLARLDGKYSLKEYAVNDKLKRKIYGLVRSSEDVYNK